MKTNRLVLVAAVAFALAAVSPAKADDEALLSPRAKGNQIHTVSGTDSGYVAQAQGGDFLSPRARGNQITRVAGTNNDPDLVAGLQSQFGSPHGNSVQGGTVYQIAPMK